MKQANRLQLTPDDVFEAQQQDLQRKTQYHRQYWQKYKKKNVRVFGALDVSQYEAIKELAEQNHRSVWAQIWADSCAYRNG